MKKYIDYLNELNGDELLEGLLSYGMFNAKLPDIFSSKAFYKYCIKRDYRPSNSRHDWIRYDNNRNNQLPRQLGIPNPFAYYLQCVKLKDSWDELLKHFENVTSCSTEYKISRIHIRKLKKRNGIFEMNYNNYVEDVPNHPTKTIGAKYIVKSDISNCFDSIYTHTIAWAVVGKQKAKKGDIPKCIDDIENILATQLMVRLMGL